jgi:manganese-dependent ADP-ribose/CDP-alcohol diphosphatase
VIADIQYCDVNPATNFKGTETRDYRGGVVQTKRAVALWNSLGSLAFVAQLGDLIDGQNAGKYGQGLNFDEPQSGVAMNLVAGILGGCKAPMYHAIGNHELYNFTWDELSNILNNELLGWKVSETKDLKFETPGAKVAKEKAVEDIPAHFSFSQRPAEGWTVIMLNSYEVSLMQAESTAGYQEAKRLLNEYNPNDVVTKTQGVNYFQDLVGKKARYVPFNGGMGKRQLMWLQKEVVQARERGDRIVVLSHVPFNSAAASKGTVCYDCDEVMKVSGLQLQHFYTDPYEY